MRSLIGLLLASSAEGLVIDRTPQAKIAPNSTHIAQPTNASVASLHAALTAASTGAKQGATFETWYDTHAAGRGIWKWNNALAAYQRHFGHWAGQPVKLAEIGVQSGGSIDMWHAVLGEQCHVYGIDINPATQQFTNDKTTIVIGDQADSNMWRNFFSSTTPSIDVLVDDGGHESHQMLVTVQETWIHTNPGGFVSIEDIHGGQYVDSFFRPVAGYFGHQGSQGAVHSIHMYPFLLIAQKAGSGSLPAQELQYAGTATEVDSFDAMWAALPNNAGGHVVLKNAAWGPFLTTDGITNFFVQFGGLHDSAWYDIPDGCEHTSAPICTNQVQASQIQNQVHGIHIYNDRLVVEVPAGPVNIQAVRKGTEWLDYR
jgi:cephalosporin hydroxylase